MHKKHLGSRILKALVFLSAGITFTILLLLIGYILIQGVPHLTATLFSLEFTTDNQSVIPALINTVIMTIVSLLVAVPIGIFSAIFLVEYSGKGNRFVDLVRMTTETLQGIPSIIYGLFGMLFLVYRLKLDYSILSGALTLAIMILPLIMRTTEEALKSVPDLYREGSSCVAIYFAYAVGYKQRRSDHGCGLFVCFGEYRKSGQRTVCRKNSQEYLESDLVEPVCQLYMCG